MEIVSSEFGGPICSYLLRASEHRDYKWIGRLPLSGNCLIHYHHNATHYLLTTNIQIFQNVANQWTWINRQRPQRGISDELR